MEEINKPELIDQLNCYNTVVDCEYQNERYSVRDNGAVYRHQKAINKKPRLYDNKWTFGKLSANKEYLSISSASIHSIVATAYHGIRPTKQHVVDHIDTNRQNNRPNNLRWLTRLENILLNPITYRRIELICGSVEAFLSDPSKFSDRFKNSNFDWMCTVTIEEAHSCKENLMRWALSGKESRNSVLGNWIFNSSGKNNTSLDLISSLTKRAKQKDWVTPCEFPLCPQDTNQSALSDYLANLQVGRVFSTNEYFSSIIKNFRISDNNLFILVMCTNNDKNSIKPFLLAKVIMEDNCFIHENIGSYISEEGAHKEFNINLGLPWSGGDTIDDFC
jgi:hypothetical protein